jgi:TATA-box binding protein (TBP) (component of TFIID and TFIIIB)
MIEIKSRWKSVADRERWAARGASFLTKAKATKAVWFPPKPVETGKNAASTAKKATKKTAKKTAKKTTGAAKKTSSGIKNVTNSARRKKA